MLGFPGVSAGEESACRAGDLGSIPGLGRSPGDGQGCPLQYSGLENSMDCIVCGVAKSRTQLSDFHLPFFSCWEEGKWVADINEKQVALRHKPGLGEGTDDLFCAFGEMLGLLPLFSPL